MALKRKPPAGTIRRVAPISNHLRYAITSKAHETVQCESFQGRTLTLLFDRDATVQEYRASPNAMLGLTLLDIHTPMDQISLSTGRLPR